MPQAAVEIVSNSEQAQALTTPARRRMIELLKDPGTAASVARELGMPRQKVNYHIKSLEKTGLVRRTGERRNGNFIEQLYQSIARRFVLSQELAWDGDTLMRALADQVSLNHLLSLGSKLQCDVAELLEKATMSSDEIPSLSTEIEVRFADAGSRAAFAEDLLDAVKKLTAKHGAKRGDAYRMLIAAYPIAGGNHERRV